MVVNRHVWTLRTLLKRDFITKKQSDILLKLWKDRDDYHHLNDTVESDYQKLKKLAKEKLKLLNKIEKDIFDFTINKGVCTAHKNPKYWTTGNQVYLRLD
jgi:hypothetical protein